MTNNITKYGAMQIGVKLNYSEFIRINPLDPTELQFAYPIDSENWQHRCRSATIGKFIEVRVILSELYALAENGLFNSTDGGRNWTKVIHNKTLVLELWNSEI